MSLLIAPGRHIDIHHFQSRLDGGQCSDYMIFAYLPHRSDSKYLTFQISKTTCN